MDVDVCSSRPSFVALRLENILQISQGVVKKRHNNASSAELRYECREIRCNSLGK